MSTQASSLRPRAIQTPKSLNCVDPGTTRMRLKSREEIHFLLLLRKTEEHFSEFAAKGEITEMKVAYFVKQLAETLTGLATHAQAPTHDDLREYKSRVSFLQTLLTDLTPPQDTIPRLGFDLPELGLKKDDPVLIKGVSPCVTEGDPSDLIAVLPEIRSLRSLPRVAGNDSEKAKEIRRKREQRNLINDRKDLFGEDDNELRHRRVGQVGSEFDDLLKAHHQAQEQVAEEMLHLTRALKEQSLAAGEIIKKDTITLEKTSELADKNTSKLAIEAERLAEHTNRSCRCWIWFVFIVVTFAFVAMVMIMKLFRKRFE